MYIRTCVHTYIYAYTDTYMNTCIYKQGIYCYGEISGKRNGINIIIIINKQ